MSVFKLRVEVQRGWKWLLMGNLFLLHLFKQGCNWKTYFDISANYVYNACVILLLSLETNDLLIQSQCSYHDGFHIWHMPILPRVENLRDVVHHYSNQGSSILQTRNRRHEQIENVLFQSDPICTTIYLRSKGTVLENRGRKACKFFEQQWITWKRSWAKAWVGKSTATGEEKVIEIIFDWQPLNTPLQKATSANGLI